MAKAKAEHTIVIRRQVCDVFAFMEVPENMPRWAESVVEAEQTSSGPPEVGSTCRIVNKAMGRTLDQAFVVTEYERDKVYAAKSTSGPISMKMRYVLEPTDDGTKLHVVSEADMSIIPGLAGALLSRMAQKQIEADHEKLKTLLESQPG